MSLDDLPIPAFLAVDEEPFTDEQLDDLLAWRELGDDGDEIPPDHEAAGPTRFAITDLPTAEWVARKWREHHDQGEEITAAANEWRARITAWEQQQRRQVDRRAAYFEALAEHYLTALREASRFEKNGQVDYRVKSLALPSARFTSTRSPEKAAITTEATVVEFLMAVDPHHPALKHTALISKLDVEIVDEGPNDRGRPGDTFGPENDPDPPRRLAKALVDLPVYSEECPPPGAPGHDPSRLPGRKRMLVEIPGLEVEPEKVTYKVKP